MTFSSLASDCVFVHFHGTMFKVGLNLWSMFMNTHCLSQMHVLQYIRCHFCPTEDQVKGHFIFALTVGLHLHCGVLKENYVFSHESSSLNCSPCTPSA